MLTFLLGTGGSIETRPSLACRLNRNPRALSPISCCCQHDSSWPAPLARSLRASPHDAIDLRPCACLPCVRALPHASIPHICNRWGYLDTYPLSQGSRAYFFPCAWIAAHAARRAHAPTHRCACTKAKIGTSKRVSEFPQPRPHSPCIGRARSCSKHHVGLTGASTQDARRGPDRHSRHTRTRGPFSFASAGCRV